MKKKCLGGVIYLFLKLRNSWRDKQLFANLMVYCNTWHTRQFLNLPYKIFLKGFFKIILKCVMIIAKSML